MTTTTRVLIPLLTILLPWLAGCAPPATPEPVLEDVSVDRAAELLEQHPHLVILDIRTPPEYDAGHLANAVPIDFTAPDFVARISELDREVPYLLHCASGGRSGQSLKVFRELGFLQIFHLEAGFNGWKAAGLPTES